MARRSEPRRTRTMIDAQVDRVRQVVSDVLGVALEQVTIETSQESIVAWDSMNILNMLLALEMEFGVQLDVEEAAEWVSIRAIVQMLDERGVGGGSDEAGTAPHR